MHYQRMRRNGKTDRVNRVIGKKFSSFREYKRECSKYWNKTHPGNSLPRVMKKRFGGLRKTVLERDGYKCVLCGMTDQQHLGTWNRHITINHIDHQGSHCKFPNNNPDNLETLCLRCHGHIDRLKQRDKIQNFR